MVEENLSGAIKVLMMETFNKIISMESESINGPMVEYLKEIGSTIVWKVKVSSPGVMVENMSVSIKMIKNMVKEPLRGLMVDAIKVNGIKESSMVRAFISKKARKDTEFGKWVKELNGSKMMLNKLKTSKIEMITTHEII